MGVLLDRMRRDLLPRPGRAHDRRAGDSRRRAPRHAQHQRHRRRAAGATASRRPASRIPAARCSTGASCSKRDSTRTKAEIVDLLRRDRAARHPEFRYELRDLMVVHPVRTPEGSPVVDGARTSVAAGARPKGGADRQPRHLRSEARRSHRRRSALRRVRARASSTWRISRTSTAASTIWSTRRKCIALAILELDGQNPC